MNLFFRSFRFFQFSTASLALTLLSVLPATLAHAASQPAAAATPTASTPPPPPVSASGLGPVPSTNDPAPPSPELVMKMNQILEAYSNEQYDVALARLDEADKLRPNDLQLLDMRGAVLIKEKKWAEATAIFNKVLSLKPGYFPPRFNLAVTLYLQKKYPEARAIFDKLASEDPKNELVQYEVYLTYLMEGNQTEAKARLDKFDFTGNTPAYYYAQAAWSFKQNKMQEGEGYVFSSLQIFSTQANNLFAEPLIEAGWLKRRGPDAPETAATPKK